MWVRGSEDASQRANLEDGVSGELEHFEEWPTDPRHGGKLTPDMMINRIAELEQALRDLVMLERTFTPDMSGKRRKWAHMQNGTVLAECLDRARALLGDVG